MSTPAAIGVNDDLASSESCVSVWSADDEFAGGVEVEDGVVVHELARDDRLDDVLQQVLAQRLVADLGGVLRRDDDRVHPLGHHGAVDLLVLYRHLGLSVGAEIRQSAVLPDVCEPLAELGGERVGEGHQVGRLVRGIAEHVTLIARTDFLDALVDVDGLCDLGGLLLDGDDDLHGLVVQPLLRVVVPDVLARLTHNLLVVNVSLGRDLAKHHHHSGLGTCLAGDLGVGILRQAGVEHSVGHLVAQLVGVALVDRLRGEQEAAGCGRARSGHRVTLRWR
mmetsp:Transcript_19617/g.47519  ORF Transcript_19617/g.47519 Transcript_19617/m.47519 type:complete len:279 (+) Transcript_19617:1967-2803(+)